jgi:hypothetical protein
VGFNPKRNIDSYKALLNIKIDDIDPPAGYWKKCTRGTFSSIETKTSPKDQPRDLRIVSSKGTHGQGMMAACYFTRSSPTTSRESREHTG